MTQPTLTQVVIFSPAENDLQAKGVGQLVAAIVSRVIEGTDTCNLQILVGENSYSRPMVQHHSDPTRQPDAAYWITGEEYIKGLTLEAFGESEKLIIEAKTEAKNIITAATEQAALVGKGGEA
jgi:hypothetical protein